MKRLYHGTVSTFLPSIHKHGLVPDAHMLKAKWTGTIHDQTDEELRRERNSLGVIFAVANRDFAEQFAGFRARLERAKQGDVVPFTPPNFEPHNLAELFIASVAPQFTKLGAERHVDARPIVLTLEVPESLVVGRDPSTSGEPAIMLQAVAPQHIKHVDFLPETS